MDTIFAHCSGKGKSGVAVFRISGPEAYKTLVSLTRTNQEFEFVPRMIYLRKIYNPRSLDLIDDAMVVYFAEGKSFTGEETVEIYTHGSIAITKLLYSALSSIANVRLATPGEFAKRAFFNGKLDLTRAEGLADLIEAETEMQHKQAIKQMDGGLERLYDDWRAKLLRLYAYLEAYIDFPDDDIPESLIKEIDQSVDELKTEFNKHLNDNNRGERLRNGFKMAILGKPNVGKSSLMNFLMKRDVAIVSDVAGTTRDIIEGHLDIGGYPVILQDTAGIHDTSEELEQEGIKRALKASKEADIKIIMLDATKPSADHNLFLDLVDKNSVILVNKIDEVNNNNDMLESIIKSIIPKQNYTYRLIKISVKENINLDKLLEQIAEIAEQMTPPSEVSYITRSRHREALTNALWHLNEFSNTKDIVLAAEDIRMTARSISSLTGKITVDEVLGEIFGKFCIGK